MGMEEAPASLGNACLAGELRSEGQRASSPRRPHAALPSPYGLVRPPRMLAPEEASPVPGFGGLSWVVPCLVAKAMKTGPDHLG